LSLQVEGPHAGILYEKKDVSEGQFAFTAKFAGEYKACFSVRGARHELGSIRMFMASSCPGIVYVAMFHGQSSSMCWPL